MFNNDNKDRFNLNDEIARGILYRGGEEAQSFLRGYAWGWVIVILLVAALWIAGWVKMQAGS